MLGAIGVLAWTPLLSSTPAQLLGCPRGAATEPGALFAWSAAGQALASPPPPATGPDPLAGQHVQLVIEAVQRRIYVFADGRVYRWWPVAVGTPATPTPIGQWTIRAKAVWGGAFGARWMQLSIPWGTYGIHGTNDPGSIGSRASHGCVRMWNRDVVELYRLVQVGTPVDIRGWPVARFGEVRRVIVPTLLGSDVLQLQERLRALGYDVPADGRYGARSVAAVVAFQRERGLRADGVVDYATAEALGLRPLADLPTLRPTPPGEEPPPPPARPAQVPQPAARELAARGRAGTLYAGMSGRHVRARGPAARIGAGTARGPCPAGEEGSACAVGPTRTRTGTSPPARRPCGRRPVGAPPTRPRCAFRAGRRGPATWFAPSPGSRNA